MAALALLPGLATMTMMTAPTLGAEDGTARRR
jgi:hypothetical protein